MDVLAGLSPLFIGRTLQPGPLPQLKLDSAYHVIPSLYLLAGLDDPTTKAYYEVMVDIAVEFGAARERAQRDLKESLNFEIQLVKIKNADVNKYPAVPMTIAYLQDNFSFIPWLSFIHSSFDQSLIITEHELVNVRCPGYLANLKELLNQTPKRVIANYIISQVIFGSRENFNRRILDISQRLRKVRFGQTSPPPRWEFCLGKLFNQMDEILAVVYVRKNFSPEKKKKALYITKIFINQLTALIKTEDWMDSQTMKRALEKVNAITYAIGYPDELLCDSTIDQYHAPLQVNKSDLYGNTLNLWKWRKEIHYRKLRDPVSGNAWYEQNLEGVTIANAQYDTYRNKIDILAAQFQGNFFAVDRPDIFNCGTLSSVIGHELTHSIDSWGRLLNKYGQQENWWTNETDATFKKKAQAIINEYSTYVVKEVNLTLNGERIQGEVIADHGGYRVAHLCLESWLSRHPFIDVTLPGLERYSSRQLFWMGAAGGWCTKERPEFVKLLVQENEHPPVEFRVNGPLRNSRQFATDWACPVGSYMNPENKVNVW